MANIVKILRSLIPGRTPASLENGQLAINQKDKKLFYPDENGAVQEFSLKQQVFIQQTDPGLNIPYIWYQIDATGSLVSIWINKP